MTEDYLQIMIESLEKKNAVLDQVMELDKRQLEISLKKPFDMAVYDATMQEKGKLIEELEKLDDGFMHTYKLVADEVQANPGQYKSKILEMQELIRTAIDKGVAVETQEQRNKQAMESAIQGQRREIRNIKVSNAAAARYYKAMSRINDVDPQLMDRKK
ncbi:MAG: flagellar protein FliT [Lachnospiraceae bacterium]|nr:flagellar protein FliT [Lachnospiraceae bacterium]